MTKQKEQTAEEYLKGKYHIIEKGTGIPLFASYVVAKALALKEQEMKHKLGKDLDKFRNGWKQQGIEQAKQDILRQVEEKIDKEIEDYRTNLGFTIEDKAVAMSVLRMFKKNLEELKQSLTNKTFGFEGIGKPKLSSEEIK